MTNNDLWKRYCSFSDMGFSQQIEHNKNRMARYFPRWKKAGLAKTICRRDIASFKEAPVTDYSDYTMLDDFAQGISDRISGDPKREGELFSDYYNRISCDIGRSLEQYMTEPYYFCMKTTGTTGQSKWIAHGRTFWNDFAEGAIATAVVACSDGWGETKLRHGDKALNMAAPVPYISGWGALAYLSHFELVPPMNVADNLKGMREKFFLMLKAIRNGQQIALGGGIGSMFYMICKYFVEPQEYYQEYYQSMKFGLRRTLLFLKLLQCKLSRKERRNITDFMPLKGIIIGGTESQLYIDFFRNEFGLEPLHAYGSTEAGNLMRGDPDRKADLVPNLVGTYLEFKTEDGEIKDIEDLKKGEVYDLVISPFGSLLFRYDMKDLFRVIDFRDDGMPIFAFEGRDKTMIRLYSPYIVSPTVIVKALYNAGLRSSEKWAVIKLLKPREHLHFLMEKSWPHSESEAEKIIFKSLLEADRTIPDRGETLEDYISDFGIKNPSDVVSVEYLKPGAFLRYSMIRAKEGSPIGQYKPPKIIPSEKPEIYETLRSA